MELQELTNKVLRLFDAKTTEDLPEKLLAAVQNNDETGSGALTIQKWNMDKNQKFELYEYDSKVMPFLLFNMAVRNIECKVYHSDVLKQEVFHTYKIARGEKFGRFTEI